MYRRGGQRTINMKRRPHIDKNLLSLDDLAGKMETLEADFEGFRKKRKAELEQTVYGEK